MALLVQQGQSLRQEFLKQQTPDSFARYAVFVMDYYAHHLDFNSFLLKDLKSSQSLAELRAIGAEQIVLDTNGWIEDALYPKVLAFYQSHPDHPGSRFCMAYYSLLSRDQSIFKKERLTPLACQQIFEKSMKEGWYTGQSLYFLSQWYALAHGWQDEKSIFFLQEAYAQRSGQFHIGLSFLDLLMNQQKWDAALDLTKDLLNGTVDKDQICQVLVRLGHINHVKGFSKAFYRVYQTLREDGCNWATEILQGQWWRWLKDQGHVHEANLWLLGEWLIAGETPGEVVVLMQAFPQKQYEEITQLLKSGRTSANAWRDLKFIEQLWIEWLFASDQTQAACEAWQSFQELEQVVVP
jgi:hypothetical protein